MRGARCCLVQVAISGTATLEEMIAGAERGILCTRFWYIRGVDQRTILFTGRTRDGTFLIENGESRVRSRTCAGTSRRERLQLHQRQRRGLTDRFNSALDGRYSIDRNAGEGGMGVVYAVSSRAGRHVPPNG